MTIGDELQHAVLSMQDDHQGRHVYRVSKKNLIALKSNYSHYNPAI